MIEIGRYLPVPYVHQPDLSVEIWSSKTVAVEERVDAYELQISIEVPDVVLGVQLNHLVKKGELFFRIEDNPTKFSNASIVLDESLLRKSQFFLPVKIDR